MESENEIIAYAIDFVSYLKLKLKEIERVILYGSAARGDFDKESDIDLFVDSKSDISKKIIKISEDYRKTSRFKEWELKGIKREIHIISGELDSEEWKDLKRSIINTGIILYGKYKSDIEKINQYALFSFENIKPDKKRILVFRKLFGFKVKDKRYGGLVLQTNSKRIGKGILLVPIEGVEKIKKYFQSKKVSFKIYDFWTDTKII